MNRPRLVGVRLPWHWTSFEIMRRRGIGTAFAFDDDFARQGFELVPRG